MEEDLKKLRPKTTIKKDSIKIFQFNLIVFQQIEKLFVLVLTFFIFFILDMVVSQQV